MTAPVIAPEGARLCPRDGFALVLDLEIARTAIDAGWAPVELYRCRLGHSHRERPPEPARHPERPQRKPCAVCGLLLPTVVGRGGSGGQKYHAGACAAFVARERGRWHWHHTGGPFIIEAMRWYRGLATAFERSALPPLDPLAGRVPLEWVEGYTRCYRGAA